VVGLAHVPSQASATGTSPASPGCRDILWLRQVHEDATGFLRGCLRILSNRSRTSSQHSAVGWIVTDRNRGLCCVDGSRGGGEGGSMKRICRSGTPVRMPSGFNGFRFPPEVIVLAVRWYQRYGLSYRDLEELLAERGIEVDHVTLYRWVQAVHAVANGRSPAVSAPGRGPAGSSTKPTSRSPASGPMSTGRSTSTAR